MFSVNSLRAWTVGNEKPPLRRFWKVSAEGLEPATNGLKGHCSTIELRAHNGLNSITQVMQRQQIP